MQSRKDGRILPEIPAFARMKHPGDESGHRIGWMSPFFTLIAFTSLWLQSCAPVEKSTTSESFASRYGDFTYAELDAVKQSSQNSCGAAVLDALLNYWKVPASQETILAEYPPLKESGYTLGELHLIARQHGLQPFLVSMASSPNTSLEAQIRKGRPVIIALKCPKGRYFGGTIPIIERFDSETVTTLGKSLKDHFVIVTGFSNDRWLVMDPAYGLVSVEKDQLSRFWKPMHWASLIVSP
jgi:predicted double-glycine peptidase